VKHKLLIFVSSILFDSHFLRRWCSDALKSGICDASLECTYCFYLQFTFFIAESSSAISCSLSWTTDNCSISHLICLKHTRWRRHQDGMKHGKHDVFIFAACSESLNWKSDDSSPADQKCKE
jgi:hypothetical protein